VDSHGSTLISVNEHDLEEGALQRVPFFVCDGSNGFMLWSRFHWNSNMLKRTPSMKPKKSLTRPLRGKPVVGWREWAILPDLAISRIKTKIDTGAKTSSLHAYDVTVVRRHGREFVRFKVHPLQRNKRKIVNCEALLVEWRQVTDSGGKRTLRPVIETRIMLGAREVMAEVTLIARDEMGFRMLIGRQALKREWIVDPSRSFMAADDVMFVRQAAVRSRTDEEE
jgi:hypothetical protein